MWFTKLSAELLLLTAFSALSSSAASLGAFAGAIGGSGNGNINGGCTTYGPPAALTFFNSPGFDVPAGGIVPCGYTGSTQSLISAGGPLVASQSVTGAPEPGGGTFAGTGSANAQYGILSAYASGTFTGTSSGLQLAESAGAAFYTDSFNFSSPSQPVSGSGSVRYDFTIHGSLSGQSEYADFWVYVGGTLFPLFNAVTYNGSVGTVNNAPPPSGMTAGPGSLSGTAVFETPNIPITFGQSQIMAAGLLAEQFGNGVVDFHDTATLTGIEVFDANGNPVSNFSVVSGSGTEYGANGVVRAGTSPVPEPGSFGLSCGVLLLAAAWARRTGMRFFRSTTIGAR